MSLLKLVEMSLVKDMCNIAQADVINNAQLRAMVEQVSREAEHFCRRTFTYGQRIEYFQSYDQQPYDPVPQYCWSTSYPIDLTKAIEIVWAMNEMHDTAGTILDATDYQVDADRGLFVIRRTTGVFQGILPLIRGRLIFCYAPRGFRITYYGGYSSLNPTPTGAYTPDPLDDYDVLNVPLGLRMVLARKIAEDWRTQEEKGVPNVMRVLKTWTAEQLDALHPWRLDDTIFE